MSHGKRTPERRYDYLPGRVRVVDSTARMDDYAAKAAEGTPPHPNVETLVTLGPSHYRVQLASSYATGQAEFYEVNEGFVVAFGDCRFSQPVQTQTTAPDTLRIRVSAKARGEYCAAEDQALDLDGPSTLVMIEPAGSPAALSGIEGEMRSVQVCITRSALTSMFEGDEGDLPKDLQAFVAETLERSVARRLPLSPALLRCLEDLLDSETEGRTRRYFIQAKATEILCHAIEALRADEGAESPDASAITARAVQKARSILQERFMAPPALDSLAREVGLSRTSLTVGFRKLLGESVFDCIHGLRMQHALALLNEPGASITQVAYAVGYNHPSSFSAAIQRHFGASPSELRSRGRVSAT